MAWSKESLIDVVDVDDVDQGHESRLTWIDQSERVWSDRPAHPAIITREVFDQAARVRPTRGPRTNGVRARSARPYALAGSVDLRAVWPSDASRDDRGRARCRFPAEYARVNSLDHPKAIYVRGDHVVPVLDRWLAEAFAPDQLETTTR